MIALAAGELRRVLARRMVRVLALLAVAAIALAGVLTFLNSEKLSPEELAARRAAAEGRVAACIAGQQPETARQIPTDRPPAHRHGPSSAGSRPAGSTTPASVSAA